MTTDSANDDDERSPLGAMAIDHSENDVLAGRRKALLSRIIDSNAIFNFRTQWKKLVFGQILAFLLACTGATQATLNLNCSLSAPTFTVGLFYSLLACHLVPLYCCYRTTQVSTEYLRQTEPEDDALHEAKDSSFTSPHTFLGIIPLQTPAYTYLILAFMDVYANYFTVLAFKYTTITSVTLFDALAIPSSMIISRVFLSREYNLFHLLGVVCCMIGITINVLQDYNDDITTDDPNYTHKLTGDLLAITGGVLFGVNDVLAEVAVRHYGGPTEYLGMMGFFATVICVIQTILLERDEVAAFFGRGVKSASCSNTERLLLLAVFLMTSTLGYLGGSRFLQISEATFLNLSYLTGDLWSVAFSVFAERIIPSPLFFVALLFTVSGVVLYEMAPSPVKEDRTLLESRWSTDFERETGSETSTASDMQLDEMDENERSMRSLI